MKNLSLKKLIVVNLIVLNVAIIFLTAAFVLLPTRSLATTTEIAPQIESNRAQPMELDIPEKLSRRGNKYEYKITYTPGFVGSDPERDVLERALNNLGDDGWELFQTDAIFNPTSGSGLHIFIYKRQK
ncbi:MAG: DUF4177 domain-containing protein [Cyanobacteriota bacterium]|nr:DUF4177 domain-containing protein [Cyanobacteriota bacterium]